MMQLTLLYWSVFAIHIAISVGNSTMLVPKDIRCPRACACSGTTVDCSHRGLTQVPRKLPANTERLDLQNNNITALSEIDFQHLTKLRILRLNNNLIRQLSDNALSGAPKLLRLDLSHNKLVSISGRWFKGIQILRSLQLNNNQITCVDANGLKTLTNLEILTLNNNNLTTLPHNLFKDMNRLRTLQLADNPLSCDCAMGWLSRWLREVPRLMAHARCFSPQHLRGQNLLDLQDMDFKCSGLVKHTNAECATEQQNCPHPCKCSSGIVDCREKSLTRIPENLPLNIIELRLEQNEITEIPSKAFVAYRQLRRIDISHNKISRIFHDAFRDLKSLSSLVLYGNKIKELPSGVFHGLSSLQLLLLNANEISCVRYDTFKDLHSLSILSLYDNNIQTLVNGTFASLKNIRTLHLARNPFVCDCALRWLTDYLHRNPIETSGARCDTPKRMQRRRIDSLRDEKFSKCRNDIHQNSLTANCGSVPDCPELCDCEGTVVDCSERGLLEIPRDIPLHTTELLLNGNNIRTIRSDGLFGRLPNLVKLDLCRNSISEIEPKAFEGAIKVSEIALSYNQLYEIHNKMFTGLYNLKSLSINNNRITCVMPGSFDFLTSLHTLHMQDNPFNCNCHLAWLGDWLRRRDLTSTSPRCKAPFHVKDVFIKELPYHEFKCLNGSEKGCLGKDYCPPLCTCTGTVIRCSRLNLTELPENLPSETSELYLESNEISVINSARLRNLKSLTRLDLSNNHLTMLSNFTFANLTKLSTLIISYNKLQCIQRDALRGLKNLRILSLHGNQLSMIPEGTFTDLQAITHIALGNNPLYCDCSLSWLSDLVKLDYVEPGIARCAEPLAMKDKLLLSTPSSLFQCKEKVSDKILAKCNSCYTLPCQNNGKCIPKDQHGFHCVCPPGYHGTTCEHMIDACYGNPCSNNGSCTVLEEGRFSCECMPGYTGARCETNMDDCINNNCQNNATCIDQVQGYQCKCLPGYIGEHCESKISLCSDEYNPCRNNAKCIEKANHYVCECASGYKGENCTENIDDCINNLCQNGASCIDGVNDYVCRCANDYIGKYCESAPSVAMMYPQTSPCQHHECQHGVCFQPNPANADYICKCAPGYSGKRCEYLTSLTFNYNNSYVELEPLRIRPDANVTIVFSTTQPDGVLLYDGQKEHLAVELFNGRIRVSYDVGNYPVSTMYSFEMVADGHYHTAELLAVRKNFTLRVNHGLARSIINEGSQEYLRLTTPLYLGGVPSEAGHQAYSEWHLRNISSFKGCFREVWINHKLVDFGNAAHTQSVTPGCSVADQNQYESSFFMEDKHMETNPCDNNQCKRGSKCVLNDSSPDGYVCKCSGNTHGRYCDEVSVCRKEQLREYYTENGCRSKKPLKTAKCVGECKKQCCQARKVKRRKVRLICSDGTRYTKYIDVVRRCACSRNCY